MPRQAIPTREFLRSLPLFGELPRSALRRLESGASTIDAPKGTLIAQCGEPCAGFHVVVFGQVKLALRTPRGDEKVTALLGRGDRFGEAETFLRQPYQVTAEAIRDSMLLHVSRSAVLAEIRHNPEFAQRMIEGLSRHIRDLLAEVEGYTLRSATQRVARYLLNEAAAAASTEPVPVVLPATKALIASRLNLTQEHFSRILHELVAAGAIEVRGRSVLILNAERLRRRTACSAACACAGCGPAPPAHEERLEAARAQPREPARLRRIARTS